MSGRPNSGKIVAVSSSGTLGSVPNAGDAFTVLAAASPLDATSTMRFTEPLGAITNANASFLFISTNPSALMPNFQPYLVYSTAPFEINVPGPWTVAILTKNFVVGLFNFVIGLRAGLLVPQAQVFHPFSGPAQTVVPPPPPQTKSQDGMPLGVP